MAGRYTNDVTICSAEVKCPMLKENAETKSIKCFQNGYEKAR